MRVRLSVALLLLALSAPMAWAIEFGCFVNAYECGGMEKWPGVVKEMRGVGMTTGVIWARSINDLTFQVDTMLDAGMLPPGLPMFVILETPERREPLVTPISGWAVGEMEGGAATLKEARAASPHPGRWPELIPYGPDEPGHGEVGADVSGAKQVADAWHSLGFKSGAAVEGANVMDCIPFFDVIAIAAEDGYNTGQQIELLRCYGKDFWVYDAGLPQECSHNLAFRMGRWCALRPDAYLFWSWQRLMTHPGPWVRDWLASYKAFVTGIPK